MSGGPQSPGVGRHRSAALRRRLLGGLLLALLSAAACSSVEVRGGAPTTGPDAGSEGDGDGGPAVSATTAGGDDAVATCGGTAITAAAVTAAEPRLADTVVTALADAGIVPAAPERWVTVRHDATTTVIADPAPLTDDPVSFWVRAVVAGLGAVHDGPCVLTGPPPAAEGPLPADCSVTPVPGGIVVTWSGGGSLGVLRDGEPVAVVAPPGPMGEAVTEAWAGRRAEHTEPEPAEVGGPRVHPDPVATGAVHHYLLRSGPEGSAEAEVDCGTVEAEPAPDGSPAGTPSGGEGNDRSALAAAADALRADAALTYPYHYVTVVPVCPGCDGTAVDVYLTAAGDGYVVDRIWIDGVARAGEEAGPWAVDPVLVPDLLLGSADPDASWSIDPATQLVVTWEADGVGARLLCIEADLRPLEMRSDELCGDFNRLAN